MSLYDTHERDNPAFGMERYSWAGFGILDAGKRQPIAAE
ncbi:hypothetical protein NIES2104_44180 [Leptolyngbya sp. NIES-2104]|nr:hypothetical protein NIES2104_44180 [Leptolyngbya sp. NIES-2104]